MDSENAQDPREERANELYWESDESVNHIADGLDLSKGVLYGMIRPLPAGLACPECRGEMAYPNRTARERGFLTCPACGQEEDEEALRDLWRDVDARPDEALEPEPSGTEPLVPAAERVVLGVALLGAAAGFVLGRLSKRG